MRVCVRRNQLTTTSATHPTRTLLQPFPHTSLSIPAQPPDQRTDGRRNDCRRLDIRQVDLVTSQGVKPSSTNSKDSASRMCVMLQNYSANSPANWPRGLRSG